MTDHYDDDFYRHQREKSFASAMRVLPLVLPLFPVKSMIDFGCGVGTWLAAARKLGVERAVGVEGTWVSPQQMEDPEVELRNRNLEQPVKVDETFDLAMSVEVAEHLDASRAPGFLDDLCHASRRVLFSAAIPGQGGAHHVNEQWQSYWSAMFRDRDYVPFDLVRPRIWSETSIPIHYRQNVLLYVHRSEQDRVESAAGIPAGEPWALDVVHPELFQRDQKRLGLEPNLRDRLRLAAGIPGALLRAVGRRLGS